MKKKITIDLWADITCPFCYIGETLLVRALEKFEHRDEVEVKWRSCILRPDWELGKSMTWKESMSRIEAPEQKALFEKKTSILRALSEKYGLRFNLENAISHNSINAARLLKLAGEKGKTLALATAFGKGYFEEALNMGEFANLRAKAFEVGLDAQEIDEVLAGDRYLDEVKEDQKLAEKYAYNYVPTMYFNGGNMLEGLLKEEQISEALIKTANEIF